MTKLGSIVAALWLLGCPSTAHADPSRSDDCSALDLACGEGNGTACFALGGRYANGEGVTKDEPRATALFLRACELEAGLGCLNAGYAHKHGRGVKVDLEQALHLYERACDLEVSRGCNHAGLARDNGEGCEEDAQTAVILYQKACDMGLGWGCYNTAATYRFGVGFRRDPELAESFDRRACQLEILDSCAALFVTGAMLDPESETGIMEAECTAGSVAPCRDLETLAKLAESNGVEPRAEQPSRRIQRMTIRAGAAVERSKLDQAWLHAREAALATEGELGTGHPALVPPLLVMAEVLSARGEEERAAEHLGQAIALALRGGETSHSGLADALAALARCRKKQGHVADAADALTWAVTIRETLRPRPSATIIDDLEEIVGLLLMDGRQMEAVDETVRISRYLRYLHIDDQVWHWTEVAREAADADHLAFARRVGESARDLAREKGAGPFAMADVNLCLAEVYAAQGDGNHAVARATEASDLILSSSDADAGDKIYILQVLGSYESLVDRTDAARRHLGRALALVEANPDTSIEDHADVLTQFASTLMAPPNPHPAASRLLLERALSLQEHAWEEDDPRLWHTHIGLGMLAHERMDHLSANEHLTKGYELYRAGLQEGALGDPASPALVASSFRLIGQEQNTREYAASAVHIAEHSIRNSLDFVSEREAIAMVQSNWSFLGLYLSSFDRTEDARDTYSALLRWKGLVGRSLQRRHTSARSGGADDADAHLAGLADAQHAISELSLAGSTRWSPTDLEHLEAASQTKDRIERHLAAKEARERHEEDVDEPTPGALCRALAEDTALVDFVRYPVFDPSVWRTGLPSPLEYTAFVTVGGRCEAPIRIDLGRAEPIDDTIEAYRRSLGFATGLDRGGLDGGRGALVPGIDTGDRDEVGAILLERVWTPLVPALEGRQRILLVPDGALHALPFAALEGVDGRFLVRDHTFGVLTDASALLEVGGESDRETQGALVLGGVDFERLSSDTVHTEPQKPADQRTGDAGGAPRASACWNRGFSDLPGTAAEARSLAERFATRYPGEDIILVDGPDALESRLARDMPGRRVVHLATHGFFGTDGCTPRSERSQRSVMAELRSQNPMVLSGLVLSGANTADPRFGDVTGYWTAEEIAGLDLEGTELVVLSACDTGLGEIRSGEGVMGLRRAFARAGVGEVVMSLWAVPDDATQQLMDRFYEAYLAPDTPCSAADALREAQLSLLEEDDGADPGRWAGFVCSGTGI